MMSLVTTAGERCRRCYSCVRRCPAKAIRVRGGQAEVIQERCVACGRCISVCSQNARTLMDVTPRIVTLLKSGETAAMLAPSFPAGFPGLRPGQVIAALRRAGFSAVHEVAFGADLVSRVYREQYAADPDRLLITTPCPAAVSFICKYATELIPFLAPVLSPMAAMGKAIKTRIRPGCNTVFVGPCTAKFTESVEKDVHPWVDGVMTFQDVPRLLARMGIDPATLPEEEFDPPFSNLGAIFPINGGLARSADLPADLLENRVADVSGPEACTDVVAKLRRRVREGNLAALQTRVFDMLFCKGCVEGPAINGDTSLLTRKERVVDYIRSRRPRISQLQWLQDMESFRDLDLSRGFTGNSQLLPEPREEDIQAILTRTGKPTRAHELNCRACGYFSCREKAVAVYHGLAEEEMCLPYLVERLESMVTKLNRSNVELTDAHAQLLRAERLASMGQLAAGIAHEVNNPLGTILIYAHLLHEQVKTSERLTPQQLSDDVEMILNEATRCKTIVGGLLDFARQNKVNRAMVDVRDLVQEAIHLSVAQNRDENIRYDVDVPENLPQAFLDQQQMLQVLLNIIRNAVEIMPGGGTVTVTGRYSSARNEFTLSIRDTGPGIPPEHMNKLFSPFFTTKPVGRGTGLGLPICYGIVKMHRGSITARNNPDGPGATFEIVLPGIQEEGSHVSQESTHRG